MIRPNMLHVNAIVRAEFYMDGAMGKVPEPRMRKQLEDDLVRLAELKLYIIKKMADPPSMFDEKEKL